MLIFITVIINLFVMREGGRRRERERERARESAKERHEQLPL